MASSFEERIPCQAVQDELRAVCAGAAFARATEAVRLLRFLVKHEQAGEADKLREVIIGCALYGRDAAYDPKLDAVVRVNATRLRARLEEHYAANPLSPLRIVLPRGSYVPVYLSVQEEPSAKIGAPAEIQVAPILPAVQEVQSVPPPQDRSRRMVWLTGLFGAVLIGLVALSLRTPTRDVQAETSWMARPFSKLGGMEEFPAFSPDGQSVVFAWTRTPKDPPALYLQEVASDVPQALTVSGRPGNRPAWSPDGKRLAFVVQDGDSLKHVMVRAMPGGRETEVATLQGKAPWLCQMPKLSWAPDGRELFTSATTGVKEQGRCGIVAIDLEHHSLRALTESPEGTLGDVEATASRDGRRVAFLRSVSYGVVDVYLVNADGGAPRRVTFDNREIMGMAWKPRAGSGAEDDLILAARGEDGTVRLAERDLRTGSVTLLTDGVAPAAFPALTEDTRQIAFTSYRSTANIYRASGSEDVGVVIDQSLKSSPELSPDGKQLTYVSDRTGFAEIWVSDADGRNGVRLTHSVGTGAQSPSWTPDGSAILFECRDRQHSQICMIAANGKGLIRRLTGGDTDKVLPTLSHDGRFIYYSSNVTGKWEAYRQPLEGGEPVRLTSGGGVRAVESWDGKSVYLDSGEGGVGVLRVPFDQGMVDTAKLTRANRAFLFAAERTAGEHMERGSGWSGLLPARSRPKRSGQAG
jgi:Tol biopolymer transport system component